MLKAISSSILILLVLIFIGVTTSGYYLIKRSSTYIIPSTTTTISVPTTTLITTTSIKPTTTTIKSFVPGIPIKIELLVSPFTTTTTMIIPGSPAEIGGSKINLIAKVSVDPSYGEAKNTTAKIVLPEEIEFVSGDLIWNEDLKPNQPISFSAIVKTKQVGNWTIEAIAEYPLGPGSRYVDTDKSCISAYEDKFTITSGECSSEKIISPGTNETKTIQPNITCRGVVCDGFCFTDHIKCNNGKIVYSEYGNYFIHEKGEAIYSGTDAPINVYVDYPKSVYPDEIINLNVTFESTSSANEITINNVNLNEWKTTSLLFGCWPDYNISETTYQFENNTSTVLSVLPYTNKTISYILKASPYPTPYGVRIFITLNLLDHEPVRVITNPITVYNMDRNVKCGNKIFDPKVGSCSDEILYPSLCDLGCNSNQMCPDYAPFCIDHECEARSRSRFQANTSYEIPIVPLYLLRNKTLADELRISERSYMNSIVSNATNWWGNEIVYWQNKTLTSEYVSIGLPGTITPQPIKPVVHTISSNFSVKYEIVDCNIYLDEYLSIAQQNSNDSYKTYNEIISRCNLNRDVYKIIGFIHVLDPDVGSYPISMAQNLGDIMLTGGFIYYNSSDPRGKYYSRGNANDVLIHETLHSFGLPDLYSNPGLMYYQYDCYLNILNENFPKHICPKEAFLMGIT